MPRIPARYAPRVEELALPALRDLHAAAAVLDNHDLLVRELNRAGVADPLYRALDEAGEVLEHAVRTAWTDGPSDAPPVGGLPLPTHTPEPWWVQPTDGDPRHPFRIEADAGHVADVPAWSRYGTPSPTAAANAALLGAAAAMARSLQDLLRWAEVTGGWEAACWDRARTVLATALGAESSPRPEE